ncbi:uncharacterized protein K02A2.6-like [Ornithodoros turicata]|uniref:uncharacterized protein K02A2.6-like n=1 Tax=Ornithodoros turicata TaxID=34597 RepID=UPI003139FF27
MVVACELCQGYQRANPQQPLLDRNIPDRPWERIAMDFFHLNDSTYLILIDYFSKFVEVKKMEATTAVDLIHVLSEIYARFGTPSEVLSDNGPPFHYRHFTDFNKQWNIFHVTSSPRYPRANGQVERAVQTIKASLKKALEGGRNLNTVLLEQRRVRTTPVSGSLTPAVLLMGRPLGTMIPAHPDTLNSHFPTQDHKQQLEQKQRFQHRHGDQHTKELQPLDVQQPAWYWDSGTRDKVWKKAIIKRLGQNPRS